jgi:hypothetical protein
VACRHRLCGLIGGACSIVITRSRGCRPNITSPETSSELLDEVRTLIVAIEEGDRAAAVRLAQIVRREALDDRNVLAVARRDELDFADALASLVRVT